MVIKDCQLTHQDSTIIRGWSLQSAKDKSHTGVDVSGETVYSICYGVVIAVKYDGHYNVTIQYDSDTCVRYCNMSKVEVEEGQPIRYNDFLGLCDRYVHFEYCKSSMSESPWAVRINNLIYYKCNPIAVLLNREMYFDHDKDNSEGN